MGEILESRRCQSIFRCIKQVVRLISFICFPHNFGNSQLHQIVLIK